MADKFSNAAKRSRLDRSPTALDQPFRLHIQAVQILHSARVLQNLSNLQARADQLQNIAVVFERAALVLGGMAHLETVLQNGDQLLDLAIVQHARRDAALGRQALEQVDPFGPLAVGGAADGALVRLDGDGELVAGDEVVAALREAVVDLGQDLVLFLRVQRDGQLRQILLFGLVVAVDGLVEELRGPVEFVAVRGPALRVCLAAAVDAGGARGRFAVVAVVVVVVVREVVVHSRALWGTALEALLRVVALPGTVGLAVGGGLVVGLRELAQAWRGGPRGAFGIADVTSVRPVWVCSPSLRLVVLIRSLFGGHETGRIALKWLSMCC